MINLFSNCIFVFLWLQIYLSDFSKFFFMRVSLVMLVNFIYRIIWKIKRFQLCVSILFNKQIKLLIFKKMFCIIEMYEELFQIKIKRNQRNKDKMLLRKKLMIVLFWSIIYDFKKSEIIYLRGINLEELVVLILGLLCLIGLYEIENLVK